MVSKKPYEQLRMDSISSNAKASLLAYVERNDRESIRKLIETEGAHILNEEYDHPRSKPILHIACEDLANSAETVKTLINLGADLRQRASITQREAIHAAVEGKNPRILELIVEELRKQDPAALNATAIAGNTALNLLVRSKDTESENFKRCLEVLLKCEEVDVDKADAKSLTPILWAAYKGYKDVVQAILDCGKRVDIDTHKLGGKNARAYIQEKNLYSGPLASESYDSNKNSIKSPITYIRNRQEYEFLQLKEINPDEEVEEGTILQLACKNSMHEAVQRLLDLGANVYKTTARENKLPIQIVAEKGLHETFKILIIKYTSLPEGILTTLLINGDLHQDHRINYKKCLNIIFEEEERRKKEGRKFPLPVNEYSDTGNTPLHYSSDPEITLKLLERGASLANKNKYNFLPIEDINTETLEEFFDSRIATDQAGNDKQSIIVKFDYTSLIPASDKRPTAPTEEVKAEAADVKLLVENVVQPSSSEAGVIHVMSKIPEMHHLLVHPLIASFVDIKWHRMRWFFRINLALFLTFCVTFVAYVFVPVDGYSGLTTFLWVILILSYSLLILRELFQLVLSFRTYCCSLSNVLEVTMLAICFYPIFSKSQNILYKQLSSIAMVLIALEVMVLLGQHPKMSTNIVMLRTVTKNFFSFLLWYAVLIIAFVLCFYNLYNTDVEREDSNATAVETDFFVEPGLTFIKTIVMLTGEFDASSINFDSVWNRLIFLLFVFMIPIILFNLLNGLAVSDTQQIKKEAEIIGYRERINYIVYMESIILGSAIPKTTKCILPSCFNINLNHLIPQKLTQNVSLIPDFLPEKIMKVLLYHDGVILEEGKKPDEGCFDICQSVRISKNTVKRVKHLLHKRNSRNSEDGKLDVIIRNQEEILRILLTRKFS